MGEHELSDSEFDELHGGRELLPIDRLMPELSTWALAAGALQLDQLLASTAGMGTSDVRRALGMRAA